jgi:hypothetical protein
MHDVILDDAGRRVLYVLDVRQIRRGSLKTPQDVCERQAATPDAQRFPARADLASTT